MSGQLLAELPFSSIWGVDFEFIANPGEQPLPVCLVARELRTGELIRLWRDDLQGMTSPPYPIGPDSLFVAYFASAELGCHLALGWPMPLRILDLFTEFRALTNGHPPKGGNSLLGALAHHGLASIEAGEKNTMRELILSGGPWDAAQQGAILDYCQSDVDALARLLPAMAPRLDLARALLRGRYMAAVAHMEWAGIPMDMEALAALRTHWGSIKERFVDHIDADFGIYDGLTFKLHRFEAYLARNDIPWPRLATGQLDLSARTFKERASAYPHLEPLRQCRKTLAQLRLQNLAVGSDGRNRCLLSPFGSRTGRNTPSNSKFIFGAAAWLRSLIRPSEGRGLAYIDWSAQEIAIAAALSEDQLLMEGYRSGDPYLAFGQQAGVLPANATKQSHKAERDRLKAVVLGTNYGMGPEALAAQIGLPVIEARQLLALHRATYRTFWRWAEENVARADLNGVIRTVYGWPMHIGPEWNPRAALNFPMQANGADIMRLAAMLATEAGIVVCAPVHDAFLIEADLDALDDTIIHMRAIMAEASRKVLNGFEIRTDAEIVRPPERYSDERGVQLWQTVLGLLGSQQQEPLHL